MASVDFHCKCKGGTSAKPVMKHNDREERMKPENKHANPHLDKAKTKYNLAYKNISYAEAKLIYDKRILELDSTTNTNKRKDRVTMFGLEIPRPPELRKEDHAKWFNRVCNLVEDWVGKDNFIEGHFHVDEVHDYYDTEKKEWCTSVEHCHLQVIPEIDGKLNAKAFSSRKRMVELNNQIDKMTKAEFGVRFMTGKGKRYGSVEDLKVKSANAVRQIQKNLKAKSDSLDRELEQRRVELETQYSEIGAKLADREAKVTKREKSLSEREKSLKTQISALQDIPEAEARLFKQKVKQVQPDFHDKIEKSVQQTLKNFKPNVVIDHRSETDKDMDLTK